MEVKDFTHHRVIVCYWVDYFLKSYTCRKLLALMFGRHGLYYAVKITVPKGHLYILRYGCIDICHMFMIVQCTYRPYRTMHVGRLSHMRMHHKNDANDCNNNGYTHSNDQTIVITSTITSTIAITITEMIMMIKIMLKIR